MQSIGKISYRWQEEATERYLFLRPLEGPSDRDWIEAIKQILNDYQSDHIFMIIDIVGFDPVLTKHGFDEIIKNLHEHGLRKSTVAIALNDPNYDMVTRLFEASSGFHGVDLVIRAFGASQDAVRWLNEQMAGD
jgi:hypothetical protein